MSDLSMLLRFFQYLFEKRFFNFYLFFFLLFFLPVNFIEEGVELTLLRSTVCSQKSNDMEMTVQVIPYSLARAFQS